MPVVSTAGSAARRCWAPLVMTRQTSMCRAGAVPT